MRRLVLGCILVGSLVTVSSAQAATYWVQVNGISFYTYNSSAVLTASPTGDPTVNPGDTILWEWGNSGSHDVVSGNLNTGTPDGKFNTNGLRGLGATFTYTTPAGAASYTYFCTPHRSSGMKGTIKATGTINPASGRGVHRHACAAEAGRHDHVGRECVERQRRQPACQVPLGSRRRWHV